MEIGVFWEEGEGDLCLSPTSPSPHPDERLCEGMVRSGPSAIQEEGSHEEQTRQHPDFELPRLQNCRK